MTGDFADQQVNELQAIEQQLQSLAQQKQLFDSQLIESQSALREVKKGKQAYRIVGSIMVDADPETLARELDERIASLTARIDGLEKQEERLRDQAKALQEQILDVIKSEKKRGRE